MQSFTSSLYLPRLALFRIGRLIIPHCGRSQSYTDPWTRCRDRFGRRCRERRNGAGTDDAPKMTRVERFEMSPHRERAQCERDRANPHFARPHLPRRAKWGPGLAAFSAALIAACSLVLGPAGTANADYGIAMHGEPALPPGFAAFPYVNSDAPKGGQFIQGILGTFDSLNPFNGKGLPLPESQVRG